MPPVRPARPTPLSTSFGNLNFSSKAPFSPLPSELPRTPISGQFDALKSHDEAMKTPISPPTAYTEFLKATINSPAMSSPRRHSYSPVGSQRGNWYTPSSPYPRPSSALAMRRKSRTPRSPVSVPHSPSEESPSSSYAGQTPTDDDVDGEVNRSSTSTGRKVITIKQLVTTTVTYTPRMSLMPAPKGKRRRMD